MKKESQDAQASCDNLDEAGKIDDRSFAITVGKGAGEGGEEQKRDNEDRSCQRKDGIAVLRPFDRDQAEDEQQFIEVVI